MNDKVGATDGIEQFCSEQRNLDEGMSEVQTRVSLLHLIKWRDIPLFMVADGGQDSRIGMALIEKCPLFCSPLIFGC